MFTSIFIFRNKIKSRTTPIKSYLLDMNHLANYWDCNEDGQPRVYHHTPPVNLIYALREALAQLAGEKLENVWIRHAEQTARLYAGIKNMGLEPLVENNSERRPTVTTVKVPGGVDWKHIVQYAMDKYVINFVLYTEIIVPLKNTRHIFLYLHFH